MKYYRFLLFFLGTLAGLTLPALTLPALIMRQFGLFWSGLVGLVWIVVAAFIVNYFLNQELRKKNLSECSPGD